MSLTSYFLRSPALPVYPFPLRFADPLPPAENNTKHMDCGDVGNTFTESLDKDTFHSISASRMQLQYPPHIQTKFDVKPLMA